MLKTYFIFGEAKVKAPGGINKFNWLLWGLDISMTDDRLPNECLLKNCGNHRLYLSKHGGLQAKALHR
jgi:hypothetical protein